MIKLRGADHLRVVDPDSSARDWRFFNGKYRNPEYFRRRRIVQVSTIGALAAAALVVGFFWPNGSPTSYQLPKGVEISEPFDVTSIAGQPVTDENVSEPTYIGIAGPDFGINGLPNPASRILFLGALVAPNWPNNSVEIYPQGGDESPVIFTRQQIGQGQVTVPLPDNANLALSINRTTGHLVATFSSQAGGSPPQQ